MPEIGALGWNPILPGLIKSGNKTMLPMPREVIPLIDQNELESLAALWGSEMKNHVLLRVRRGTSELDGCLIYDRVSKTALVIEDEELASEVARRMAHAGVPIVDKIPDQ